MMQYSICAKSSGRFDCSQVKMSAGQFSVVRAGFDDLQICRFADLQFFQPFGKLKREQLAKQFAGADAGDKNRRGGRRCPFLFHNIQVRDSKARVP